MQSTRNKKRQLRGPRPKKVRTESYEEVTGVITSVEENQCKGPNSGFIKLVSAEGEFILVTREEAMLSETIKNMLNGPCEVKADEINKIKFKKIKFRHLQIVHRYMTYKLERLKNISVAEEFKFEKKDALEMCFIADFLGI
ncbi:Transcription elongation factor B (SIII), polypeptide 1 (15kDa, elongin C) [Chamberlinius hualienensis]